MWDLTVPGNNDHDFYVIPAQADDSNGVYHAVADDVPVLVHNIDPACGTARNPDGTFASGENAKAASGRSAHNNYENTLGDPNYVFNQRMPGSLDRPDAINWTDRIVRELKPDTPATIQKGWSQVNGYKAYLEQLTGETWTAYVDIYSTGR